MAEDVESRENIESAASKKGKKSITIEFIKPDDFKQIYAIGAAGGHSPYDFRIGFYNDTPKMFGDSSESRVIERRVEAEVILSPVAALELNRWLTQHINEYESVFGPIARAIPRTPRKEPAKSVDESTNIQGYI
ncbi:MULTISPECIES: DUF3467 domain-containing protein [Methanosarcina]|jgi:hypothetical protein|uniref:DUF3467 domain-containing protein n=8 Tax=Methanosarcina mazei TaxID=2209 RepID=A0A0F8KS23_METMZ|nr:MULTISPECIES: DUF3467 domain-containing protein [Methanosarcina]AAM32077.1 conserved protein [Methanosarcina mazei Go1]AGF97745.1 Hypothetical protein MmTuc01_2435 [Methanosarcina mazei Tuc01]AKB41041.1 hypothetical protein MSMAW_2050 [Methanosarcina mazei WWM610]AKB62178.1 hypothetical protein MSMAP_2193 [Methanosarcina mazei SarPi]AKB65513.1 hypothetical protein MSMAS_2317 [Methanosarcina mazei S-6]